MIMGVKSISTTYYSPNIGLAQTMNTYLTLWPLATDPLNYITG